MTSELPPITRFLVAHGPSIESSSFVAEELTITFKPEVTSRGVVQFMADLINDCNPVGAIYMGERTVRLIFHVQQ